MHQNVLLLMSTSTFPILVILLTGDAAASASITSSTSLVSGLTFAGAAGGASINNSTFLDSALTLVGDAGGASITFSTSLGLALTFPGDAVGSTFSGIIDSEDFNGATVAFAADIDSIDTNQADRDGHLKSGDFFDAANHPKLAFEGKIENNGGDYSLVGNLTMRGTTKAVELDVTFGGIVADPYGQTKAGFEIEGKVNRKDFGLSWSAITEAGSVVVSDQVRLVLSIQLVKQA